MERLQHSLAAVVDLAAEPAAHLQVELEEEAERQRAPVLDHASRSAGVERQVLEQQRHGLLQERVVPGPADDITRRVTKEDLTRGQQNQSSLLFAYELWT